MNEKLLIRLRRVGFAEGVSFLILLFIAMPLKYYFEVPEATKIVGMAHGVLFLAYVGFLYAAHETYNWGAKFSGVLFVASLLPFGTFVTDKKIRNYKI